MTPEILDLLMGSIAADNLVIITGAGLSVAAPSSIPGAAAVASECAKAYLAEVGTPLPTDVAGDLEKTTRWFRSRGEFESLFLVKLVPWPSFLKPPNLGHEAIADFLCCGIAHAATTTNYDCLVEEAARSLGEVDFQAIFDVEGSTIRRPYRNYLKAHGCCSSWLTRSRTIWCEEQLVDSPIAERSLRFRTWLNENLAGRDLLIVGFWSDWAYLNEVFAASLLSIRPNRVILIDPSPEQTLRQKAPQMWAWAHGDGIRFLHEPVSGTDLLDALRKRASLVFLRKVLDDCRPTYQDFFHSPAQGLGFDGSGADSRRLYSIRRSLTGVPRHRSVHDKEPRPELRLYSAIHARLLDVGAAYDGHLFSYGGKTLRLLSGAGELMSQVCRRYADEPPYAADRVICVGAEPDVTPGNIMRPDEQPTLINGGVPGNWETHDALVVELRGAMLV